MKKQITISLIFLGLLTFSCEKHDDQTADHSYDLQTHISIQENTSLVSNLFFKTGVTKIIVETANDESRFFSNTTKPFFLNGDVINMSDYEICLKGNFLKIGGIENYRVSMQDGKPYIVTPKFRGLLTDANDDVLDNTLIILLFYLNELTMPVELKGDNMVINSQQKGCSFWDTYYVFGVGLSSSTATDKLDSESDEYGMEDCTLIGDADVSCIWGSHGCVATQAYCCE